MNQNKYMLLSTQDSMQKLYLLSQNSWSNRNIPIFSVLKLMDLNAKGIDHIKEKNLFFKSIPDLAKEFHRHSFKNGGEKRFNTYS